MLTQTCSTVCDTVNYIPCQAPLSMGFPRQECWNGLPFLSPGDLLNPGIESVSPALAGQFFTTVSPGKPNVAQSSILLRSMRTTHFSILGLPLQFSW